jgi:hypothetical protein
MMIWVVHVARVTDKRDNTGFRLGDLKEGRAFGRTCCRWEDNEERLLKKYNVRA